MQRKKFLRQIICSLFISLLFSDFSEAHPHLTVDSRIDLKGLGVVRILMTPTQVEQVAGIKLVNQGAWATNDRCYYLHPVKNELLKIGFMVQQGKIVRIDVEPFSSIKTLSGAVNGISVAKVKAMYGDRLTERVHPYLGERGSYLIYTPKDKIDRNYGIIFETAEGKIVQYRVGLEDAVSLIEGCN